MRAATPAKPPATDTVLSTADMEQGGQKLGGDGRLPIPPIVGVLVAVAIYFASMVMAEMALSLYPLLKGWSTDHANSWLSGSPLAQFLYVALVEALTLALLYGFLRGRRLHFRSLGLRRPRPFDALVALAAYPPYFIVNAVLSLSAAALLHLNTGQAQQTGFENAHSTTDLVLTFISLVILPPFVEEIVMRGFLFGALKNGMTVVRAALVTSVIFAIAHLQFGSGAPLLWAAALDTFILSLVLCYLRQRSGSLWPGIGLHALKNALAFSALFIFPHFHYSL